MDLSTEFCNVWKSNFNKKWTDKSDAHEPHWNKKVPIHSAESQNAAGVKKKLTWSDQEKETVNLQILSSKASEMRSMSKEGESVLRFACSYVGCLEEFQTTTELLKHVSKHFDTNSNVGDGENCIELISTYRRLMVDISRRNGRTHSKAFLLCPMKQCKSNFPSRKGLLLHIQHHFRRRKYSCTFPNCAARFFYESSLFRHRQEHFAKLSNDFSVY
uniref:Zinc finger protein GLIS1 n=1 Tax=Schistocephalus solidus TaxID=70667 RepID=A0A0X3NY98_SCHSO